MEIKSGEPQIETLIMDKFKYSQGNIQMEPIDLSMKDPGKEDNSCKMVSNNPSLQQSLALNNNNIGDLGNEVCHELLPVDLSNKQLKHNFSKSSSTNN